MDMADMSYMGSLTPRPLYERGLAKPALGFGYAMTSGVNQWDWITHGIT